MLTDEAQVAAANMLHSVEHPDMLTDEAQVAAHTYTHTYIHTQCNPDMLTDEAQVAAANMLHSVYIHVYIYTHSQEAQSAAGNMSKASRIAACVGCNVAYAPASGVLDAKMATVWWARQRSMFVYTEVNGTAGTTTTVCEVKGSGSSYAKVHVHACVPCFLGVS